MMKQLSVFVENKPGSFLKVTKELQASGIRVYAFCSVDSPEFGILRLIVDCPDRAAKLLEEQGFMAKCYDVLAVELTQEKTLDALLGALHESNINVSYMYSAYGSESRSTQVILYSEYLEETEAMLAAKGFCCVSMLA